MGDTHVDPVDHSRTTRQHAGETMKNGHNVPGLLLMAVGVVSLFLGLAGFATGNSSAGTVAVAIAATAAAAGGSWLFLAHRRVRVRELRRAAVHPSAEAPPPTS